MADSARLLPLQLLQAWVLVYSVLQGRSAGCKEYCSYLSTRWRKGAIMHKAAAVFQTSRQLVPLMRRHSDDLPCCSEERVYCGDALPRQNFPKQARSRGDSRVVAGVVASFKRENVLTSYDQMHEKSVSCS